MATTINAIQEIYNLFGYNTPIFIHLNELTNQGITPVVLKYISSIFFFANFPIFYLGSAIIIHIKIRNKQKSGEVIIDLFNENFVLMTRILICYFIFCASYTLIKFSVNMPRPYCSLNEGDFFTIANTSSERCLSSFPSAHTAFSVLVVYFLLPYLNNKLKPLAILAPFSVALSRISLAMHYPSDILASALIAPLIIMVSNYTFNKLRNWNAFESIREVVFENLYRRD